MKNLIKAVTTEQRQRLEDFITSINQEQGKEVFLKKYGYYSDLIPRGKDLSKMNIGEIKAYLISRKEKAVNKAIEREVNKITTVYNAGELLSVKISVEWVKSRMWGMNPKAECWVSFKNSNGHNDSHYFASGSIGGCGYDKLSTAVAEVLNQCNEVLKPMYKAKNEAVSLKNDKLLGYGSGYGILPYLEGGVGVSCYPTIFERIGFKFETVASGKTFDVFTITKNK